VCNKRDKAVGFNPQIPYPGRKNAFPHANSACRPNYYAKRHTTLKNARQNQTLTLV
jgi:hypothetical protein